MDFIQGLDQTFFFYINSVWTNSWLDSFFPAITDLHKNLFFNLVAYPVFLGLFYWKFKNKGLVIFFGLLVCLGCSDFFSHTVIKKSIQRPRPGNTPGVQVIARAPYGGFSFTSNHASNMFALATYSSSFIPQLAIPIYTIATLVSYSRVYNGVHFPLDVIFGGIFGYFWGLIFSRIGKRYLKKDRVA